MSAELLAEEKAEEHISPEVRAKRKRFHERLGALRSMNKTFADTQRKARLEGKPSKGRVHKSKFVALKITVILTMMLRMKGKPLTYMAPEVRCRDRRCDSVITPSKRRFIHNIRNEDLAQAQEFQKEISLLLDLDEFVEEHKDK